MLTWSKDQPTVPGWYFFKMDCGEDGETYYLDVCVYYVAPFPHERYWGLFGSPGECACRYFLDNVRGLWAGPIPEPESEHVIESRDVEEK